MVWLEGLKADAKVRYLTPEAAQAGVRLGARYATMLQVVPDLLAGSCTAEELQSADSDVIALLRKFSPQVRRRSQHLEHGLYLLDASGLSRAFKGMKRWARELVSCFQKAGWEVRTALGFTPFATEMATYHLTSLQPIRLFDSLLEEERKTMATSLSAFSLSPVQLSRLRRFHILTLGDLLALDMEEVKKRFGGDLLEFYEKAAGAIFAVFAPLPEPEPLMAEMGFPQPVCDIAQLLESARRLLQDLLPSLLAQEQAVATVRLECHTEDEQKLVQILRPTYPTADLKWLLSLIKLRLEKYFQKHPLGWGCRIERLRIEVKGEADPEKQGELFTDWVLDASGSGEQKLAPRDKQAGLWALSQVRAEFGESALVRAQLVDHYLPDRDHAWKRGQESLAWLNAGLPKQVESAPPVYQDQRVRRIVYQSIGLTRDKDWSARYGPYRLNGGWWGESFAREYSFAQKEEQTAWLYQEEPGKRWRVQGWLQ